MNNVIFSGNLVNDMASNTKDGKMYAYNKIGVYNGKDKDGNFKRYLHAVVHGAYTDPVSVPF